MAEIHLTRNGRGGAAIAVQFVLNFEEGAENSVLDGDAASETFLSEITPAEPFADRHMSMESLYEYGSRAGLWRLLRIFERRGVPLTVFAVARAMQRNPEAVAAFKELGHEIACHGLRWKSYQLTDRDTERAHMAEAVQILQDLTGAPRSAGTPAEIRRIPGSSSSSTAASSTTPTRMPTICPTGCASRDTAHLVVPYTLDTNDMRFASPAGLRQRRRVFRASARRVRCALRRRATRTSEDALGRITLPAGGPSGAVEGTRTLP